VEVSRTYELILSCIPFKEQLGQNRRWKSYR